jgi:hypothetical protein
MTLNILCRLKIPALFLTLEDDMLLAENDSLLEICSGLGGGTRAALTEALRVGVRHIDTAAATEYYRCT